MICNDNIFSSALSHLLLCSTLPCRNCSLGFMTSVFLTGQAHSFDHPSCNGPSVQHPDPTTPLYGATLGCTTAVAAGLTPPSRAQSLTTAPLNQHVTIKKTRYIMTVHLTEILHAIQPQQVPQPRLFLLLTFQIT